MTNERPSIPTDILEEFMRDAASAGYTSKRKDSPKSRWHYLRKCLSLARKYREELSLP